MKDARGTAPKSTSRCNVELGQGDRHATKVIEKLKALSPSLVASGAIKDARASALDVEPPPKRAGRS